MPIWSIADLHLSHAVPDRLKRFGGRWRNHVARLEENWRRCVRQDDLVLIPGDFSLSRNHRDVQPDLEWLERMPGIKVLAPGNHDTWWNRVDAVRELLRPSQFAVDGDAIVVKGCVICGGRGFSAESVSRSDPQSEWQLELGRIQHALKQANSLRSARQLMYVLCHYPPFDRHGHPSPIVEQLEAANATACVYGHLHQIAQWATAKQGKHGRVHYFCVAADAIGFCPLRVDLSAPA